MESVLSASHKRWAFALWLETIPIPRQLTATVLLKEKRIARHEFRQFTFLILNIKPFKITYRPPMTSTACGLGSQMETQSSVYLWRHLPRWPTCQLRFCWTPSCKRCTQGWILLRTVLRGWYTKGNLKNKQVQFNYLVSSWQVFSKV